MPSNEQAVAESSLQSLPVAFLTLPKDSPKDEKSKLLFDGLKEWLQKELPLHEMEEERERVKKGAQRLTDLLPRLQAKQNIQSAESFADFFALLDLHRNSLPPGIGLLMKLADETTFKANGKQLSKFPVPIIEWNILISLDLGNNRLSSLPVEISQLRRLKELRLDHNELTSIPAELSSLKDLKLLDVYDNRLLTIPSMPKLQLVQGQLQGQGECVKEGFIVGKNPLLYRLDDVSFQGAGEELIKEITSELHRGFEEHFANAETSRASCSASEVIKYYNEKISENLTIEEAALQMLTCSLVYLDDKFSDFKDHLEFNITTNLLTMYPVDNIVAPPVDYYARRYRIKDSLRNPEGCIGFYLVPESDEESQKAKIILFRGTKPNAKYFPTGIMADLNRNSVGLWAFTDAKEYIKKWAEDALGMVGGDGIKLVITGHSLGGALAMHTFASIEEPLLRQKNVRVVTFNAPGVDEDTIRNKMCGGGVDVTLMSRNICMVCHDWDVVQYGGFLQPPGIVVYTGDLVDNPSSSLTILRRSSVSLPDLAMSGFWGLVRRLAGDRAIPSKARAIQNLLNSFVYAHTAPTLALRQMHGHAPVDVELERHDGGHVANGLGPTSRKIALYRDILSATMAACGGFGSAVGGLFKR